MSEADFQAFKESHPGMKHTCLDEVKFGREWATAVDDPDCFQMMPAQRWTGLWNSGWEWSMFCPDPATKCKDSYRGIALKFADSAPPPDVPISNGILFHVEFIGRRTKVPGYFDHQGQYKHLMVVDRLLSMKQVPRVVADK
jgi:hypothetical protein